MYGEVHAFSCRRHRRWACGWWDLRTGTASRVLSEHVMNFFGNGLSRRNVGTSCVSGLVPSSYAMACTWCLLGCFRMLLGTCLALNQRSESESGSNHAYVTCMRSRPHMPHICPISDGPRSSGALQSAAFLAGPCLFLCSCGGRMCDCCGCNCTLCISERRLYLVLGWLCCFCFLLACCCRGCVAVRSCRWCWCECERVTSCVSWLCCVCVCDCEL